MKTLYSKLLRLSGILLILLLLINQFAMAEGTKTISPTAAYNTALAIMPSTGAGSYLGCGEDNRIYFRINNHTTENLYFGFNWQNYTQIAPNPSINTVYLRIYNPSGTLVAGPIQLNNAGEGYINTHCDAYPEPDAGMIIDKSFTFIYPFRINIF